MSGVTLQAVFYGKRQFDVREKVNEARSVSLGLIVGHHQMPLIITQRPATINDPLPKHSSKCAVAVSAKAEKLTETSVKDSWTYDACRILPQSSAQTNDLVR